MDENPVCIIGIGCHLPGGIRSPSDLWDFLAKKQNAQSVVPSNRFNVKGFYDSDGNRAGAMNANGGYFIQEDVRLFENTFFGINNMEAAYMDPQQRKLLEVVFECLENSGDTLEGISGTNTGVYVGSFTVDHQTMQARDPDTIHRYSATGVGTTILANRISHVFNLQGPSFTLDTACSSSIYCLDSAVNALKRGDCDSAIVAAVNLIAAPEQCLASMKAGVLSPTSTCHTFDASADGYGRADAVNAIYLKRMSSAMRDKNKIRAVIRATAVNSNGRTPGITQPSAKLQEAVIRKAYSSAGLMFADTDYVECHGTGTPVGDPIEVDAIARCFSRSRELPLLIGAVKTNLGHSEAASGITSLIKVILALEHGRIPPTRGVVRLNPNLRLESSNMRIVTEMEEWPRPTRRASVNSFGYGGANAHAILEAFDTHIAAPDHLPEHDYYAAIASQQLIIPVSAFSEKSLESRIRQICEMIPTCGWNTLQSLAYTLSTRRSKLKYRQLLLVKPSDGGRPSGSRVKSANHTNGCTQDPLPYAFVFTGQGAHYAGMARELLERSDDFRATIQELDHTLQAIAPEKAPTWCIEWSIAEHAATSPTYGATFSQTVCTAIQIAIVNILRCWNINPVAVIGHSSGEIAAAYSAGLISQSQAILTAYFRGYAVDQLHTMGLMMAVGIDIKTAQNLIQQNGLNDHVCVACVNAPESLTLSGTTEGIKLLQQHIQEQNKFCRILLTDGRAYHSHMIIEVGEAYEEALRPIYKGHQNSGSTHGIVQMCSSVGNIGDALMTPDTSTDWARYWRDNLENPVQFDSALRSLVASTDLQFIEVGPHPALKGPVNQILASMMVNSDRFRYAPTLVRDRDADLCMKELAGTLFMHGHDLNWEKVNSVDLSNQVPIHNLPPYPWDYSTKLLYHESRSSRELRNRKHVRHELLGSQQYAGNGIDWNWRNHSVRLEEMPWMRDHTVSGQVVFPAAGYLAMVIEGLNQIQDAKEPSYPPLLAFEFRSVSFNTALIIDDQNGLLAEDTELHTTISPRKISTMNTSSYWYDFSISSYKTGKSTVHCVGSVREVDNSGLDQSVTIAQVERFERVCTERWYDKFALQGLEFGRAFRSVPFLDQDKSRERTEAVGIIRMRPPASESEGTFYPVHPITIDACLQAGIMSTCAGNVSELQAYLPVFIKECRIDISSPPESVDLEAKVHAQSKRTGVSTRRISCTLRDSANKAVIHMEDVRMSLYLGSASRDSANPGENPDGERHPCLYVNWKPDIQCLQSGSEAPLQDYIASFIEKQDADLVDDENVAAIGSLLDLAGHKKPQMRVLELGDSSNCKSSRWSTFLNRNTPFSCCGTWRTARIVNDGKLSVDNEDDGPFDVIIITGPSTSEKCWGSCSKSIISILANDGIIITRQSPAARASLEAAGLWLVEIDRMTLLSRRLSDTEVLRNKTFIILVHDPSTTLSEFASFLSVQLQQTIADSEVKITSICDVQQIASSQNLVFISLLELEVPYLATMGQPEIDLLHNISNAATHLLWVTGAGMLTEENSKPDLTLSSGLSRALMLEQPSLRFAVLDVGPEAFQAPTIQLTCNNIIRTLIPTDESDDKEYAQLHGMLYTSRFEPASNFNSLFQNRIQSKDRFENIPLNEAKPAQLSVGKVGVMDTIHFQQVREPSSDPPSGFADIEMQVMSLNAKDVYALNGRVETQKGTTAMEFGGVVVAIGPGVPDTQLKIGDRVIVVIPNHFTTTVRVPVWAAHRINSDEDLTIMSGLPVAYSTALYALNDRANLRSGESIMIHSGTGALGIAAIVIAQRIGATVYTTVGSSVKRDWIINNLGLPTSNIFSSRDANDFVAGVRKATRGRGVDVIVNSLTGDLMHDSWDCLAQFGRFIEVGKRELVDAGKLDMSVFLRNATFTAFDLSELYFHRDQFYREMLVSKMREVLDLFRAKEIKPLPTQCFDVSEITSAYRYFSKRDRVGKVVISLRDPRSSIPVSPAKYLTILYPEKVYLLVGCLGGLGRSLSSWLLSRGARNFVFLGRSGDDRPAAKALVSQLQEAGADVSTVRGDVCLPDDVGNAIQCCVDTGLPIGGVIQASMGLSESLFSRMSGEAWQKAVRPKWAGTRNLDSAIRGLDDQLDFFMLMSSISGSVGTATESNYCAANSFLDAFARKGRREGRPYISLGLGMVSEVGYLHENPEIEALLLRRGIQPLNEEEFLQMVDFSLMSAKGISTTSTSFSSSSFSSSSHILTGLEPLRLRQLRSQGFDISHGATQDPRSSILSAALQADKQTNGSATELLQDMAVAPWLMSVPPGALAALKKQADAPTLEVAILRLAKKCFSNLILLPTELIDDHKALNEYGVDSMIASEFRTWFWNAFKVDVSFLDILSQGKSLHALSGSLVDKLART
ncbi:polyketide synthase [Daldinia caldariorum]|uniref:polyketide synthase n=1 Tax=Daldinia caldariorum TaxID=326644 RepID=UPI0020073499|nr:polyketide synthase [Daldinia caldariorum]KAI1467743.1 polyketide synthase [Daldinia caldariorum]